MTERSNIDEVSYLQETLPLDVEKTTPRTVLKVLDTNRLTAIDKEMDRLVDEMSAGHVHAARYKEIESKLGELRGEYMRLTYVPPSLPEEFEVTATESYPPLMNHTSEEQDTYAFPLPDQEEPADGGETLYDLTVGPNVRGDNRLKGDKSLLANIRRRRP